MVKYRKIWEKVNGPIPEGYHIHHIDGNRDNNDISNLMCVSPQEHFDIHLEQGDISACNILQSYIQGTANNFDKLSRMIQARRLEKGTHNFLDPEHRRLTGIHNARVQSALVEQGKHHWQTKEHAEATSRRMKGTKRPEIGPKISKKLKGNTNGCGPKPKLTCPHCGMTGGNSQMKRWHFDNCKVKA